MPHVLHVLDGSASWDHRVAIDQLRHRLPPGRFTQGLAVLDASAEAVVAGIGAPITRAYRRLATEVTAAPSLRRALCGHTVDLVHAWGARAASVAAAALRPPPPMACTIFDPAVPLADAKLLRTLGAYASLTFICPSATVRRRLIENGIAAARCVVVRPGVDFGLLNRLARSDGRAKLGIDDGRQVWLTSAPVRRDTGQYYVVLAGFVRSLAGRPTCVIVPGASREQRRLQRIGATPGCAAQVICPGPRFAFEELLAFADALVIASPGDVSTTAISWAMAASVPVVASAVYSVAELISHGTNGVLFKAEPGPPRAITLAALFDDKERLARVRETARGQAYQAFGLHRCIEQHARVYTNMIEGRAPADGITDTALAG